jgi:hypothetical protein
MLEPRASGTRNPNRRCCRIQGRREKVPGGMCATKTEISVQTRMATELPVADVADLEQQILRFKPCTPGNGAPSRSGCSFSPESADSYLSRTL